MSFPHLKAGGRPHGCKDLKQPVAGNSQGTGDNGIRHPFTYLSSFRGLSLRQKTLLWHIADAYARNALFSPRTKVLAGLLSCSRPTLHRVLRSLEGDWIVIKRTAGKRNRYEPTGKLLHALRLTPAQHMGPRDSR